MILSETLGAQELAAIVISKKGYILLKEVDESDCVLCIATNDKNKFYGNNCVSLLGLIELGETRDENWRLNAQEMTYTLSVNDSLYD
jgi:hypothetical protein